MSEFERPTEVYRRRPTNCSKCGATIGFIQNKNGRWFPVDLFGDPRTDDWVYKAHFGNHNNMTPWHRCDVYSRYYPFWEMRNEITIFDHDLFDQWMEKYQSIEEITEGDLNSLPKSLRERLVKEYGWVWENL